MSKNSRVRVYTTNTCGYCRAAKRLLEERGVSYEEINLSDNHDLRQSLVEETGWRTVPMIVIDDALVGGYMELVAFDREGKLVHLQDEKD